MNDNVLCTYDTTDGYGVCLIGINIVIVPHGWANGYVGVPKNHPWHGKGYDDIHNVSIHGGLTYCEDHMPSHDSDGRWWVGFDTAHGGDNMDNCNETYCRMEVQSLLEQARQAWADHMPVRSEQSWTPPAAEPPNDEGMPTRYV